MEPPAPQASPQLSTRLPSGATTVSVDQSPDSRKIPTEQRPACEIIISQEEQPPPPKITLAQQHLQSSLPYPIPPQSPNRIVVADKAYIHPPRFVIDLSRPPEHRYDDVAAYFRAKSDDATPATSTTRNNSVPAAANRRVSRRASRRRISEASGPNAQVLLNYLYNSLCKDLGLPVGPCRVLGKMMLRRIQPREALREIRGISRAAGVDLHLLVALNVLLDALMGCTSGGVRVGADEAVVPEALHLGNKSGADYHLSEEPKRNISISHPGLLNYSKTGISTERMLHFRSLDWGMEPLRHLVVRLDFRRNPAGPVIARTVTYFGFVGILTGVRPGLSLSLNFRPTHDRSSLTKRIRFRLHQLLVLMGMRKPAAGVLRKLLLADQDPDDCLDGDQRPCPSQPTPRQIAEKLRSKPSTAAYIILCDGKSTVVMEKDNRSAVITESSDFLTAMNHDAVLDKVCDLAALQSKHTGDEGLDAADVEEPDWLSCITGRADLMLFSAERMRGFRQFWLRDRKSLPERPAVSRPQTSGNSFPAEFTCEIPVIDSSKSSSPPSPFADKSKVGTSSDSSASRPGEKARSASEMLHYGISYNTLMSWMHGPTTIINSETHFACIMDPVDGLIRWLDWFPESIDELAISENGEEDEDATDDESEEADSPRSAAHFGHDGDLVNWGGNADGNRLNVDVDQESPRSTVMIESSTADATGDSRNLQSMKSFIELCARL